MIDNITSQMAQEEKLRIMEKINLFEREPKSALMKEIEYMIDEDKMDEFKELREKVVVQK